MRTRYKKWAQPLIKENINISCCLQDIDNIYLKKFLNNKNLYLEIGCGKGLFLLNLAKKYPGFRFLGIEKNITISGIALKEILKEKLNNIYIISEDILKIYDFLKVYKFNTIFLNHPDPWPKKRHEKRRLTYKSYLEMYKNLLTKQGYLILKTDNDDLFDYSLKSLENNNYKITDLSYDYKHNDEFDEYTNYEINFINKNIKIKRLKAQIKEL